MEDKIEALLDLIIEGSIVTLGIFILFGSIRKFKRLYVKKVEEERI